MHLKSLKHQVIKSCCTIADILYPHILGLLWWETSYCIWSGHNVRVEINFTPTEENFPYCKVNYSQSTGDKGQTSGIGHVCLKYHQRELCSKWFTGWDFSSLQARVIPKIHQKSPWRKASNKQLLIYSQILRIQLLYCRKTQAMTERNIPLMDPSKCLCDNKRQKS